MAFLPLHRPDRERLATVLGVGVLPLHLSLDGWLNVWQLSPFKVEAATILFRNVVVINVLREGGVDVLRGQDEDLGDGDGIKPALDPTPDGGKEARGTDNLRLC